MPKLLFTLPVLLMLSACGGSENKASAPDTSPQNTPPVAASPSPKEPTFDLAAWEKENVVDTNGWYKHVTSTEVSGSAIVVETDLHPKDSNKETASRICGTYSTARMQWNKMTNVYVRASDGDRLAKCGPGL